jgi:hypothetical protein
MRLPALFRRALPAAALLLAGCQMTTFETVPLAADACDPGLEGHWLSVDEDHDKVGEVALRVSADCELVVESREKDGLRTSAPTALHLGRQGLYRYAWVNARWALTQFDENHPVPGADAYLLRFAQDGDRLTLWTSNDKAVAHAIIDGELQGEVVSRDSDLFNRLTGEQAPAVLDHPALFNADPVQFQRRPEPQP